MKIILLGLFFLLNLLSWQNSLKAQFTNSSFSNAININSTLNRPSAVGVGDLNDDGKMDFVVGSEWDRRLVFFINKSIPGSLDFNTTEISALKPHIGGGTESKNELFIYTVKITDLNGDGLLDIYASGYQNNYDSPSMAGYIIAYQNRGTLTTPIFNAEPDVALICPSNGRGALYSDLGDLDGDGKLDVAAKGAWESGTFIWLNNSTIDNVSFSAGKKVDGVGSAFNFEGIRIIDVTEDQHADIIYQAGQDNGNNQLFLGVSAGANPGNFSIASPKWYDFSSPNYSLFYSFNVADFDGDGKNDYVVADSSNVIIGYNTGNADLNSRFQLESFPKSTSLKLRKFALGDLNKDGKIDLAIGHHPYNNTSNGSIGIYKNNSTSGNISIDTYGPEFETTVDPGTMEIADFDVDGNADILVIHPENSSISILLNKLGLPGISSISPRKGKAGETIKLKGSGFSKVNTMYFAGSATPVSLTVINDYNASVVIPDEAISGPLSLIRNDSVFYQNVSIRIRNIKVLGFSSTSGYLGQRITINGNDLDETTKVTFNNNIEVTNFTIDNGQHISVNIPVGAETGKVTLRVDGENYESETELQVLVPEITSFSPKTIQIEGFLTINGVGLSHIDLLKINGEKAKFSIVTDSKLVATVPITSVGTGKVSATIFGIEYLGGDDITVTGQVGVHENQANETFVYPNPNNGNFVIQLNKTLSLSNVKVILADISGRIVYQEQFDLGSSKPMLTIHLDVASGIYNLFISADDKVLNPQKIVIN